MYEGGIEHQLARDVVIDEMSFWAQLHSVKVVHASLRM